MFIGYEVVTEPIPNHLRVQAAKVGKWEWKNKGIRESCLTLVDEVHTLSVVKQYNYFTRHRQMDSNCFQPT